MSTNQGQAPAGGARPRVARRSTVHVGLGSNLGEREANLARAAQLIAAIPGVALERTSWAFDTAPVGPEQPRYLNAVVELNTRLSPYELLSELLHLEEEMGRVRGEDWGPRIIDLDILLWGDRVISEPLLQVPHPHLHERAFALEPLAQLCPFARHPVLACTIRDLRDAVLEQDVVRAGHFPAGW
jgi:2-amino-4-hydroxy-6-hydroxymethyldihydropteridine diphosphokinase